MKTSLSERQAGHIINQLLTLVNTMHYYDIIHGYITPENVMCIDKTNDELLEIKLTDYGYFDFLKGPADFKQLKY
jgi:serine/threonine protein kinase